MTINWKHATIVCALVVLAACGNKTNDPASAGNTCGTVVAWYGEQQAVEAGVQNDTYQSPEALWKAIKGAKNVSAIQKLQGRMATVHDNKVDGQVAAVKEALAAMLAETQNGEFGAYLAASAQLNAAENNLATAACN